MKTFTTHDKKALAYSLPFSSTNRHTAMRQLQAGLSADNLMARHAADFSLYENGEFDQNTGLITGKPLHHVCEITDLIEDPHEPSEGQ